MRSIISIGATTFGAFFAIAAIPTAVETIGGINVAPSAWAQDKPTEKPAEKPDDRADRMERRPAPNPNAGFLGAKFAPISDEIADELKLDSQSGVIVVELIPDSPAAAENGLKVNDVIQKMDGKTVEDVQAFVKTMQTTKPGQEMKFSVIRNGQPTEVSITLGKRPPNFGQQQPSTQPSEKKKD